MKNCWNTLRATQATTKRESVIVTARKLRGLGNQQPSRFTAEGSETTPHAPSYRGEDIVQHEIVCQGNLVRESNYSGGPQSTMYKHQAGEVHQVSLVASSNQPRYAVAAHSVNVTTILGHNCLGAAELDGSVKFIITRPGPQSTNDPFALNSYVSFKVRMAGAVLDPSAGVHVLTHELI